MSANVKCARLGCPKWARPTAQGFCGGVCRGIQGQLEQQARIHQVLGPSDLGKRWFAALNAASAAWTEAEKLRYEIEKTALSVGITREAWDQIRLGPVEERTTRRSRR